MLSARENLKAADERMLLFVNLSFSALIFRKNRSYVSPLISLFSELAQKMMSIHVFRSCFWTRNCLSHNFTCIVKRNNNCFIFLTSSMNIILFPRADRQTDDLKDCVLNIHVLKRPKLSSVQHIPYKIRFVTAFNLIMK